MAVAPRPRHRLVDGEAAQSLLAEALDDEERVVDADGQSDGRNHVHHEEGELEPLPHDEREAKRRHDRDQRHDQGDAGCDGRPEDGYQDEQGDRHADALTPAQVAFRGLRERPPDAPLPRQQDLEAQGRLEVLHQLDQGDGRLLRLSDYARERDRNQRRVAVGGDESLVPGLVVAGSADNRAL